MKKPLVSTSKVAPKKPKTPTANLGLVGGLLGCCLPLGATIMDIMMQGQPFTLSSALAIQAAQPLHWIIDGVPLLLGIFGTYAGKNAPRPLAPTRPQLPPREQPALEQTAKLTQTITTLQAQLTDYQQRENSLRESETFYRTIFENANDALFTATTDGVITAINRAMEALLGWSKADVVQQHYNKIVTPTTLEQLTMSMQRVAAGKENTERCTLKLIHKDGHVVPVETQLRGIYDANNTLIGYQGLFGQTTVSPVTHEEQTSPSEPFFSTLSPPADTPAVTAALALASAANEGSFSSNQTSLSLAPPTVEETGDIATDFAILPSAVPSTPSDFSLSASLGDQKTGTPTDLALTLPDVPQSIDNLGSIESEEDLLAEPTFAFRDTVSELSTITTDDGESDSEAVVSSEAIPEFSLLSMSEGSDELTSVPNPAVSDDEDRAASASMQTLAFHTTDVAESEAPVVTADDTTSDTESASSPAEQFTLESTASGDVAAITPPNEENKDVVDSEVLNISEALARLDGDKELLGEMASLFLEEYPRFFSDIREALSRQDLQALALTAHTIKGSVGNFAASRTAAAALHLERLGRKGNLEQAFDAVARLEEELSRLKPALTDLARLSA